MDKKNLGRVVVLMGGVSSEREVSLMSGGGVLKALKEEGVDAESFDPKTGSLAELEAAGYDRAFIALHGRFGEDGTIQGALNYLGLPYTGPGVAASAMAMDKETTKTIWRAAGLPVPRGELVGADVSDERLGGILEAFGSEGLVVKPARDGSSIGVSKLARPTAASLREAVALATSKGDDALIEEYVHGREFTVALLDGKALPVIEIKAPEGDYDFQNKYFGDAVKYECPAAIPEEASKRIALLCEKAFAALGARGWSRVDLLGRPDGSFVLLEINTSPGMTPHSLVPMAARAVGMSYGELCRRVLELARVD